MWIQEPVWSQVRPRVAKVERLSNKRNPTVCRKKLRTLSRETTQRHNEKNNVDTNSFTLTKKDEISEIRTDERHS